MARLVGPTALLLWCVFHSVLCITEDIVNEGCIYEGNFYNEGEDISREVCKGIMCMGGQVAYWQDPCTHTWPPCDGEQRQLPDQCCPVCLKTTTIPPPTTTPHLQPGQCDYEGTIYENGDIIAKDDCYGTFCQDGEVLFWDDACAFYTPECAGEQVKIPGECCPQCIQTTAPTSQPPGCFVNGTVYRYGDEIPVTNPCEMCMCTEDGKMCAMMACAWPCSNPTYKEGVCCPICPDGCEVNGIIYSVGDPIPDKDPCVSCWCTDTMDIICSRMECEPLPCFNPVDVPDKCCPECPGGCNVNGVFYAIGDPVPSDDPCMHCTCTEVGEPICYVQDCAQPDCENYYFLPGQCCPVCPQGCIIDGIMFFPGDKVPSKDPCDTCTCTSDGLVSCVSMACLPTLCAVPEILPGQCCPVCPQGCYVNKHFYDVGETIPTKNPCEICTCGQDGLVTCVVMDCAPPPCDNYTFEPLQCCPICPKGCMVGDIHYNVGDRVPTKDPCSKCTCGEDGTVDCVMILCVALFCEYPIIVPDQCCPACPTACVHNGITYNYGDVVPMKDPCQQCKCGEHGSLVCVSIACPTLPCVDQIEVEGKCCKECRDGCLVDGVHYDVGDTIPDTNPCVRCRCTKSGPVCSFIKCPSVNCINPIHVKGECCPKCPDGPNCAFGRRVISAGEIYKPRPRLSCFCRTDPWEPLACCQKNIPEGKGARILKKRRNIISTKLLELLLGN